MRKAVLTGDALEAITTTIHSISLEVSHIATAAEEQSSTVHGITGNIRQVTRNVDDSAAGTQQFAGAASQMYLMAEELKGIVYAFTIEEPAYPTDAPGGGRLEKTCLGQMALAPA